MPATVRRIAVRRATPSRRRPPDRPRGDEDGAAGARDACRHRSRDQLPRGRAGAAGQCRSSSVERRLAPCRAPPASPSSKSGRATGCRTKRRASRPPTRSRSSIACPRAGLAGRSRWRRSSARSGCRRWRTPARCSPASRGAPQVRYAALVPNLAGLERAHAAGVRDVADLRRGLGDVQPPQHQPGHRRLARRAIARVCARAHRARACASAATSRPRSAVRSRATCRSGACRRRLGGADRRWARSRSRSATPSASRIRDRCRQSSTPLPRACRSTQIALHFHDTRGTALANVLAALRARGRDLRCVVPAGSADARTRPGATGNLATEDLVYMLDGLGIDTGVDLAAVVEASAFIEARIGHRLPSRYYRAISKP